MGILCTDLKFHWDQAFSLNRPLNLRNLLASPEVKTCLLKIPFRVQH